MLVGLPMFVPLLRPEQHEGIEALIALHPFPYRLIIVIRMCFSLVCIFTLILAFEFYMSVCGCTFPVCSYAIRTLVVSMLLGFVGLLLSAVSRSTIVGYLTIFCLYCALQAEILSSLFKSISYCMSILQIAFLLGSGFAIIFFSKPAYDRKALREIAISNLKKRYQI